MNKTVKKPTETSKLNKFKHFSQKFKWFLFTELQDLKLVSDYIDFICPSEKNKTVEQIEDLRNLIKQSLIREFSPNVQNFKSYDLLVDAVMYNIQKKSLKLDEDIEQ